jgi:hypothetical protein
MVHGDLVLDHTLRCGEGVVLPMDADRENLGLTMRRMAFP